MRNFKKEGIDAQKRKFVEAGYQRVRQEVGGRSLEYYLLPAKLNKELPNYVFRMTGKPDEGYLIGVSQDLDRELQPYAVLEEYIEFMEKGIHAPDRVVEAESEVISIMPEALRPRYIRMRRDFFVRLLECNEKDPALYRFSKNDVAEFRKNLEMLESRINDLGY